MIRLIATALLAAACSAPVGHPAAPTSSGLTTGPKASSAEALCRAALPHLAVVAWADASVGELREYHYSGPVARYPLKASFPGVQAGQRAAWCWVRLAPDSISVWGTTPGSSAGRALMITGPGEDNVRGRMPGPPVVP